jgi:2'-5' RNA ligase
MAFGHALFCALRPPLEMACELWNELDFLPPADDRVEPERQHVTLVRIGIGPSHPRESIARVRSACASLAAGPFRVVFDQLIIADRILLKPSETLPKLADFQGQLITELAAAGLGGLRRYRFSPHLTLSYRAHVLEPVFIPPVSWTVRDFVLIESLVGERRQIERGRWALQGPIRTSPAAGQVPLANLVDRVITSV